jgi:hypothetical protein
VFNKNWEGKGLSKQATVEAIIRIHNKLHNGSKLSLNCFELLNDRRNCSYVNLDFYPKIFSCCCHMKFWVITYKLFSIVQACPLSLLSPSLRGFVTQWRHAVASVDRKIDRLGSWPTLITSKTRLQQQQTEFSRLNWTNKCCPQGTEHVSIVEKLLCRLIQTASVV